VPLGRRFSGHNDRHGNAAVEATLKRDASASLCGSGTNSLEGGLVTALTSAATARAITVPQFPSRQTRLSTCKRNGNYFLRIYMGKKQRELALGSTDELPSKKARERAADN
jgi:hypothetical protein